MKSLFNDREVRKFSFKEKITYIFKQLYAVLAPVEKASRETITDYSNHKERSIKIITCTVNKKGITLINELQFPFTDILIECYKEKNVHYNEADNIIEIKGDQFCYVFPCTMMPQIWYRLKKAI